MNPVLGNWGPDGVQVYPAKRTAATPNAHVCAVKCDSTQRPDSLLDTHLAEGLCLVQTQPSLVDEPRRRSGDGDADTH